MNARHLGCICGAVVLLSIAASCASVPGSVPSAPAFAADGSSFSIRWRMKLSARATLDMWPREQARPVSADGVVYGGGSGGVFYALRLADRSLVWKKKLPGPLTAQPAVANGTVFICDGNGFLHAYEAKSGKETWKTFVGDEAPGMPVVADNTVFIRTASGQILALDTADGELIWRYIGDTPTRMMARSLASVAIAGDSMIAGLPGGVVVSLSRATGGRRWAADLSRFEADMPDVTSTPVMSADGSLVFVPLYEGGVFALSVNDGSIRWKNEDISRIVGMTLYGDTLLVSAAGEGLVSVDAGTGQRTFVVNICNKEKMTPSAPVIWENRVVLSCSSSDSGLYLMSPRNDGNGLSIRNLLRTGKGVYSPVVPVGKTSIAMISNGGFLYVVDYVPPGLPKQVPVGNQQIHTISSN